MKERGSTRKIKNAKSYSYFVIGIDEAGRGPLAGPVVVGGVMLALNHPREERRILAQIRDSKKLSPKKRGEWFKFIAKHPQIRRAHAVISARVIDKINIARASNLGAERVYRKLISRLPKNDLGLNLKTKLDGNLYLPHSIDYQTIIKGDEKIPIVAAASIVAKVTRDRIMLNQHKKNPQYGFDRHKGYGTRLHLETLRKFGISNIHRKTFIHLSDRPSNL